MGLRSVCEMKNVISNKINLSQYGIMSSHNEYTQTLRDVALRQVVADLVKKKGATGSVSNRAQRDLYSIINSCLSKMGISITRHAPWEPLGYITTTVVLCARVERVVPVLYPIVVYVGGELLREKTEETLSLMRVIGAE